MDVLVQIGLLALGFVLLVKGAALFRNDKQISEIKKHQRPKNQPVGKVQQIVPGCTHYDKNY